MDSVKAVLASLDAQGEADHADWIDQVTGRLASLEGSYRELRNASRDLSIIAILQRRAAYVFRYVLGHADFVYDFLRHARETLGKPLFTKKEFGSLALAAVPGANCSVS